MNGRKILIQFIMMLFVISTIKPVFSANDTEENEGEETEESKGRSRPRRQAVPSSTATIVDDEISTILGSLPDIIDRAVDLQQAAQRFKLFKRLTQGWTIVVGSWLDVYSDIAINNRTLSDLGGPTTVYRYGFILFYGIGFGFPYLVGQPATKLGCSSLDFTATLERYQLTGGLGELLRSDIPLATIRSIVAEYDSVVRLGLKCITNFESERIEVEEVIFALDRLLTMFNLRLDLEAAINPSRA